MIKQSAQTLRVITTGNVGYGRIQEYLILLIVTYKLWAIIHKVPFDNVLPSFLDTLGGIKSWLFPFVSFQFVSHSFHLGNYHIEMRLTVLSVELIFDGKLCPLAEG